VATDIHLDQRLIERFDRKDPKLHLRELAQLKQTSSPETYISKFQRVVVMVLDISEGRLVMLLVEGLM
jgi:ribosomal protein S1